MIRDFKAQIFCRETNLSKREIDTADPVWIERIDDFFRRTSLLPPDGDPTEYAAAFEAVYPQPRHRRQYIADAIAKGRPCFGHKVLASLMAAGKVDCVFTTNFDPLAEDAAVTANAILPTVDQTQQAHRQVQLAHEADLSGVTDDAQRRIEGLLENAHQRNQTQGQAADAFLRAGDRRSGRDRRTIKHSQD